MRPCLPRLGLDPDFDVEGPWWNAPAGSESGWGLNVAQQGGIVFATWFTYDDAGAPLWLSMTGTKVSPNAYTGTLYRTRGPAFSAVPFDPAQVTPSGCRQRDADVHGQPARHVQL